MHRNFLASLCISLTLILASSATGTGANTPTPSVPQDTHPLPPYNLLHADRHLHERSSDDSSSAAGPKAHVSHRKALKQFNIHDHASGRNHRRHDTVSKMPTPTPTPGVFMRTFEDRDGAIQADGYMTYSLVKTVDECKAFCDAVNGCVFANSYYDVHGKDGSPFLTCSLYTMCHYADKATNRGGQSQPDGTINYITSSDGWCKAAPSARR